jgi:phosphomannomutase
MSDGAAAPLMISVSGVRGIIGASLTPAVAAEFGQAFGHFLKTGQTAGVSGPKGGGKRPVVAIGRDTRPSGPMVFGAVSAGLMSVGVDVVDVGVATTPSVALLGRFLKADAAIVITASHNPLVWNGIKFLRHDGIAFPPADAAEIKRIYFEKPWALVPIDGLGRFSEDSRAHANHVQTVLQYFDVRGIAEKRYRVVLDSVNGAGCVGTPMLLGKLGVELVHMNAEATGQFAHTPEPTKENLTDLCAKVKEKRAAVGFAQDPDADRLAIVDERGEYIGEEYTLALCTYARMLVKPVDVVANLSSSRMVDDLAAKFGKKVYRTPVGEANVAGKMMEVGAPGEVIGGEGNGGIIDLRVGPVRDSFLGMAMVLDLLTRTGKTVSALVAELPRYAMIKTKFECTAVQSAALVGKVKAAFKDERLDTQDGVRIDWTDPVGWVHVRQSNTEPIARVIAEAADEGRARELIGKVEGLKG